mmetsp:Transcript_1789/g.3412  ORF Transcript_1789/g.3412 Transcript_1789/m.3412 type:complete len:292 (-) Transcript_1789:17-892(-)
MEKKLVAWSTSIRALYQGVRIAQLILSSLSHILPDSWKDDPSQDVHDSVGNLDISLVDNGLVHHDAFHALPHRNGPAQGLHSLVLEALCNNGTGEDVHLQDGYQVRVGQNCLCGESGGLEGLVVRGEQREGSIAIQGRGEAGLFQAGNEDRERRWTGLAHRDGEGARGARKLLVELPWVGGPAHLPLSPRTAPAGRHAQCGRRRPEHANARGAGAEGRLAAAGLLRAGASAAVGHAATRRQAGQTTAHRSEGRVHRGGAIGGDAGQHESRHLGGHLHRGEWIWQRNVRELA